MIARLAPIIDTNATNNKPDKIINISLEVLNGAFYVFLP